MNSRNQDITEILKMLLVILLWIGGYSLSLELIKLYANHNKECRIEVPEETVGNPETSFAKR